MVDARSVAPAARRSRTCDASENAPVTNEPMPPPGTSTSAKEAGGAMRAGDNDDDDGGDDDEAVVAAHWATAADALRTAAAKAAVASVTPSGTAPKSRMSKVAIG